MKQAIYNDIINPEGLHVTTFIVTTRKGHITGLYNKKTNRIVKNHKERYNKELDIRAKEFLRCLGNGKSMIEIEQEEADY